MSRHYLLVLMAALLVLTTSGEALARKKLHTKANAATHTKENKAKPLSSPVQNEHTKKSALSVARVKEAKAGLAETRLIEIYRLVERSQMREALTNAEKLVHDFPNFQLAQMVYGDLLAAQIRVVKTLGDVPSSQLSAAATTAALSELRDELKLRLKALRERPPAGLIPEEFLALSERNKHAIAVDASRSRLYLFENRSSGLALVADYYVSVGKSGLEKKAEGDARTPLGVYFIISNLNPRQLKDFYGSGALPISYPNELDRKRDKTGGGIWLHGTSSDRYSRPPLATDGCVVLSNPDLEQLIRSVEVRTTPVVISRQLNWVPLHSARPDSSQFKEALTAWTSAKSSGDVNQLLRFYSTDFNSNGKTLSQWVPALRDELSLVHGRSIELKDLSILRWTDAADTMVVTFGEVAAGRRSGPTKRQYWVRQGSQWKIFYEGVIG
jgi:murein L,D-transpeptidase YafK